MAGITGVEENQESTAQSPPRTEIDGNKDHAAENEHGKIFVSHTFLG
jgi:hypothetical protein